MRRVLVESPTFKRKFRRWTKQHPRETSGLRSILDAIGDDAFQPELQTHKLHGQWSGCWASSAGYDLRIVFELVDFNGTQAVLLLALDTHDDVYN